MTTDSLPMKRGRIIRILKSLMGKVRFKLLADYFCVILYLFTYLFLPLFSHTSLIIFFLNFVIISLL